MVVVRRHWPIVTGALCGAIWASGAFAGYVTLQNTVSDHEKRLLKVENATEALPAIAQSLLDIRGQLKDIADRLP